MKRKFDFGKIGLNGTRKINPVEVEIELRDTEDGPVFTASGAVYNQRKTDCYCAGQCLEEIYAYKKNDKTFKKIYRLWKLYHLNDMHAGTEAQEKCLESCNYVDYSRQCKYLEEHNLLVDNGYRYGSAWLFREIPEEDLNEIRNLIEHGE